MKHLKRFNESVISESTIEDYIRKEFPSTWFDSELEERVFDYISSDEAEDYDDDPVKAYKNLSTGGAVEHDLIESMTNDVCHHFGITKETKFGERNITDIIHDHLMDTCTWKDNYVFNRRNITDIIHDHLMDTCTWKDNYVFNRRSTEPYKSHFGFGYSDLINKWNDIDTDSNGNKL
jgi:hypothetical protein